jgi:hypothetical protein
MIAGGIGHVGFPSDCEFALPECLLVLISVQSEKSYSGHFSLLRGSHTASVMGPLVSQTERNLPSRAPAGDSSPKRQNVSLAQTSSPVGGGAISRLMLGQFSAKSISRRIASVSEIFGFWRRKTGERCSLKIRRSMWRRSAGVNRAGGNAALPAAIPYGQKIETAARTGGYPRLETMDLRQRP